jgi:hypothetical protein
MISRPEVPRKATEANIGAATDDMLSWHFDFHPVLIRAQMESGCHGSADTRLFQAMLHPHGSTPVTVSFLLLSDAHFIFLAFVTTAHSLPPVVQSKTSLLPFYYLFHIYKDL